MKDQSAIKGNLSQINAFLMAKHGLMKKNQIRPILVSHLGIFGSKNVKKRGEEKKKKKKRKGMELYRTCMESLYGI